MSDLEMNGPGKKQIQKISDKSFESVYSGTANIFVKCVVYFCSNHPAVPPSHPRQYSSWYYDDVVQPASGAEPILLTNK